MYGTEVLGPPIFELAYKINNSVSLCKNELSNLCFVYYFKVEINGIFYSCMKLKYKA